jgi:DnaK suppressor protein
LAGRALLRGCARRQGWPPRQEEDTVDLATARTRLEAMLADMEASAQTLQNEEGSLGELSHLDQHPAEFASELSEQERDEALIAMASAQQVEVRAALKRIEDGTFGRCVSCGTTLSEERLEARPEAARCVNCQHEMEAAR